MYAVVESCGSQMRVASGDSVVVDMNMGDVGGEVVFDKVLMLSDDGKTVVGKPYVSGASVKAEIVKTGKSRKVLVFRSQPKKADNKLRGHRQDITTLKIKEIIGG
jgi:large subunit ribosomal protein L21